MFSPMVYRMHYRDRSINTLIGFRFIGVVSAIVSGIVSEVVWL